MRVAYNKYSRRFDFSAPPTFVPVLLACIACWVVSYLYSVGYPVYGEISATPLWNTICQTLPGKEFTYIIGMALMFGGAFLLHRANYVLVLIREKTMLPFLFYVLFISTNPDFFPLKSTSVGVFCLILAIYQLFTTYHDPEAREKAYSAALLIGIGSLLWVHLLWFLPLFWLASAPGKSSGDAMNALEQITASLPQGVGFEWTGQSYEEKLAGSQATLLFGLSILIVFLVLAALYESWSIPLAVILVVPLGLLGALLAVFLRDMPNDIYFKVGLITTIGLSAKNAILIVEVAREFYREGMNAAEAAVAAAKLRLRPILMTSLAFGAGVIPLAFAHGAAAGAQRAVGTGVLGGIITATLLAIFLVPLFFRLTAGKRGPDHPEGI